jgi:hypothetical protein
MMYMQQNGRKDKRNKQEGPMPVGETADPNRLFGERHNGNVKGKESIRRKT